MADIYLLKRMSSDRNIVAATSLLHEIYVITEHCDTVLVYFCHRPYELKTRIPVPEMLPADIATSYADVCVYALDSNNLCIWRIHRNTKKTKYPLDVSPGEVLKSMSITKKGVILVVLAGNDIVMYDPMDRETKRIILEGVSLEGGRIAHAVEIGDNRLLACYDTQTIVYDWERAEVCKARDGGGGHITLKNSNCAIITGNSGQRLRMLDMEKYETCNVTAERNGQGIPTPSHVHYAMENGFLLLCWQNYLYLYSFEKIDAQSYLADYDTEKCQESSSEAISSENAAAAADELSDRGNSQSKAGDDDEVMMLIQRLSTKYRGQFFLDTKDVLHIAVPEDAHESVTKEVEECRRKTVFRYQIEKPGESRFQWACGTSLRPGSRISSIRGSCFLFSGTVIDEKTGITVGHAVDNGEVLMTFRPQNADEVRQVIGKCLKTFRQVQAITERSECTLTADVAVLQMEPGFCVRRNSVQWANREFRIKIFRERVSRNTEVMVLNQNGMFRCGIVRRDPFTDTTLEGTATGNLFRVLGIGTEARMPQAITQEGDSGALVLSVPSERRDDAEDDVLYVYGIVFGQLFLGESGLENSLTIANCLSGVIPAVFNDPAVVHCVRRIPTDSIDFTQMADHDPNAP